MFVGTWRKHWGLKQDPFSCEDADKDSILGRMDSGAVHCGFDRLFGDPASPAPGIVFGEKGSGKSSLRLTMRRKLDDYNQAHPEARTFQSEYTDFDVFLEQFRRSTGTSGDPVAIGRKVREKWATADHLDAMLALGVSKLVDEIVDSERRRRDGLTRRQKLDLSLLTALYYSSKRRSSLDALHRLRARIGYRSLRSKTIQTLRIALSAAAVGVALLPHVFPALAPGPTGVWYSLGVLLLAVVWLHALAMNLAVASSVRSTLKSIRVLDRDTEPLTEVLTDLPVGMRKECVLPRGTDEATRYDYMQRFLGLLRIFDYDSWYVLFDRVDEPSALNTAKDGSRAFVERILDHKLLQLPGLALKLFLPIELDEIYRNASPEELKRMRLDKSNLVQNLNWTGQELYEIANQRLQACLEGDAEARELSDLFAQDFDSAYLRDTLQKLGTPRYAFGFLANLFMEYARNLPGDLTEMSGEWRLPRSHFDVVRSSWVEQADLMRRKLNS